MGRGGMVIFCFFPEFWSKVSCRVYLKCESANNLVRIRLFEERVVII